MARSKNSRRGTLSAEPEKSIGRRDWEKAQAKDARAQAKFDRMQKDPSKKKAVVQPDVADPNRDGTCAYCGEDAYCDCVEPNIRGPLNPDDPFDPNNPANDIFYDLKLVGDYENEPNKSQKWRVVDNMTGEPISDDVFDSREEATQIAQTAADDYDLGSPWEKDFDVVPVEESKLVGFGPIDEAIDEGLGDIFGSKVKGIGQSVKGAFQNDPNKPTQVVGPDLAQKIRENPKLAKFVIAFLQYATPMPDAVIEKLKEMGAKVEQPQQGSKEGPAPTLYDARGNKIDLDSIKKDNKTTSTPAKKKGLGKWAKRGIAAGAIGLGMNVLGTPTQKSQEDLNQLPDKMLSQSDVERKHAYNDMDFKTEFNHYKAYAPYVVEFNKELGTQFSSLLDQLNQAASKNDVDEFNNIKVKLDNIMSKYEESEKKVGESIMRYKGFGPINEVIGEGGFGSSRGGYGVRRGMRPGEHEDFGNPREFAQDAADDKRYFAKLNAKKAVPQMPKDDDEGFEDIDARGARAEWMKGEAVDQVPNDDDEGFHDADAAGARADWFKDEGVDDEQVWTDTQTVWGNEHGLSQDEFTQQVWDYAQQRYNWSASKLNAIDDKIVWAFNNGMEPMEFVDSAMDYGLKGEAEDHRQQANDREIDFPGEADKNIHVRDSKFDNNGGDDFEQEVWDYAQQRYNISASKLNSIPLDTYIEIAKKEGMSPMEFVDEFFGRGGVVGEAHGERASRQSTKHSKTTQAPFYGALRTKNTEKGQPDFGPSEDDWGSEEDAPENVFGSKDSDWSDDPDVIPGKDYTNTDWKLPGEDEPGVSGYNPANDYAPAADSDDYSDVPGREDLEGMTVWGPGGYQEGPGADVTFPERERGTTAEYQPDKSTPERHSDIENVPSFPDFEDERVKDAIRKGGMVGSDPANWKSKPEEKKSKSTFVSPFNKG